MDSYGAFEEIITQRTEALAFVDKPRFWRSGMPCLDYEMLNELLSVSAANGKSAQSGELAKGLDMWIAAEIRRAGFEEVGIWPRLHMPRALDPAILDFIQSLPAGLAEQCCYQLPKRYKSSQASILGAAYNKQVDVGMSGWLTGPEILISTKTMTSSFGKNLNNRFEEAYGDAKNLKGRHPLASVGFFFLVDSSIRREETSFAKAISMLEKLKMEKDAYDACALLLVDFSAASAHVREKKDGLIPEGISAGSFFLDIIELTLQRAAPDAHMVARKLYLNRSM